MTWPVKTAKPAKSPPFCRALFVINNPIHASTRCVPLEKSWAPAATCQHRGRRTSRQIPAESMATAATHEPAARSLVPASSGDGAECSQMQPHPAPVSRLNAVSRDKPPGGWPGRPGGPCSACPVDMAFTQEEPVGSGITCLRVDPTLHNDSMRPAADRWLYSLCAWYPRTGEGERAHRATWVGMRWVTGARRGSPARRVGVD
jgi:hypothetical protein